MYCLVIGIVAVSVAALGFPHVSFHKISNQGGAYVTGHHLLLKSAVCWLTGWLADGLSDCLSDFPTVCLDEGMTPLLASCVTAYLTGPLSLVHWSSQRNLQNRKTLPCQNIQKIKDVAMFLFAAVNRVDVSYRP